MESHPDIARIVELCNGLDDGVSEQRDIKKYLTEFLLIKACAEYEREIERIVMDRAGASCDDDMKSFVSNTVSAYRHLALDRLQGGLAGRFSIDHKREFARRLEGDAKDAYRSLVESRNAVAHGGKVSITYDEFKKNYGVAGKVLEELAAVLNIPGSDLEPRQRVPLRSHSAAEARAGEGGGLAQRDW